MPDKNTIKSYIKNLTIKFKKQIKDILESKIHSSELVAYFYIYIRQLLFIKKLLNKYPKSNESNILFFQEPFTCFYYFKRYNYMNNPVIITLHSNGSPLKMLNETFPILDKNRKLLSKFEKMIFESLRRAKYIVLLGENARNVLCSDLPEFASKTITIFNGIPDLQNMNMITDVGPIVKFIAVGTVGRRKGYDLLIESILQLDESIRNQIQLTIVGDGPLCKELALLCAIKHIMNVVFLGTRSDIPTLLKTADVFILTSRDEGMPIAAIEAMRAGLALILTNVGCNSDLVKNNKNGLLCVPESYSIMQTIRRIVLEKEKIKNFKLQSRDIYKRYFTAEYMIKNYENLFLSISNNNSI
jgi:glycosyltransferase involved in cell wall biosynthesis